jgi:hypothetical protein
VSGAETTRPAAPACYCEGAGPCGACRWGLAPAAEVPTVPAPGPCQRAALVAALLRRDAVTAEIVRASRGLDDDALRLAVQAYEAERDRLRAMRTAD